MNSVFDKYGFIEYLRDEFPSVFNGSYQFVSELLGNLIAYIMCNNDTPDEVTECLLSIIPEITKEEIERFWAFDYED